MKIEIIAVSKDKDSWVTDVSQEYLKRLSSVADVKFVFIKEGPIGNDIDRVKLKEGERILQKMKDDWITIALDVKGGHYTSEHFAEKVEKWRDFEGGRVQFIIGGPYGLSGEVLTHAQELLSLSTMTFTHQMIRVVLLEQLYRAFEILRGSDYHK